MPEDELARRLTDVERRVAILEGAVPRCGAFTPEENLAAAWDQMAKLKDNLMTLALEGRPRPAKRLEYVQLYTLRRPPGFSYGSGTMNSPDDYEKLLGADENKIASLASCLANATRVRIVMALFDGEKTSSELTAATGLSGGPLYHHLRELARAGSSFRMIAESTS